MSDKLLHAFEVRRIGGRYFCVLDTQPDSRDLIDTIEVTPAHAGTRFGLERQQVENGEVVTIPSFKEVQS